MPDLMDGYPDIYDQLVDTNPLELRDLCRQKDAEIDELRALLAPFAAEIEFVEGLADEVMYAEVATVADVRAAAATLDHG